MQQLSVVEETTTILPALHQLDPTALNDIVPIVFALILDPLDRAQSSGSCLPSLYSAIISMDPIRTSTRGRGPVSAYGRSRPNYDAFSLYHYEQSARPCPREEHGTGHAEAEEVEWAMHCPGVQFSARLHGRTSITKGASSPTLWQGGTSGTWYGCHLHV